VASRLRAYNITSDPNSGIGAWSEDRSCPLSGRGAIGDGAGTRRGTHGRGLYTDSLRYLTEATITRWSALSRTYRISRRICRPEPDPLPSSHAEGVAGNVDSPARPCYARRLRGLP